VDANRLRRLAAEVDREHRAAMDDVERRLDRRALVRGFGGFAVTVAGVGIAIPVLARAAGAQQSSTTTPGGGATSGTTVAGVATTGSPTSAPQATTTTTLPPAKPQPTDLVFLSFAQSFELAAVQAYGVALASTLLSDKVADVARAFQGHHLDHAQSFAGMAGKAATGIANQSLLAAFGPLLQAASSEAQLLQAALNVEMAAAATYTAALAQIIGTDPAALVASIQPIEARHAVVLSEALELPIDQYTPVLESTADAVTPDQYPIVER
jgi:rubrerythrin